MSRPKARVSRNVEHLAHSLTAYSDFPGNACHVLVLAALGGSNDLLGGEVVWPDMLRHSTESSMLNEATWLIRSQKRPQQNYRCKDTTL